MEEQLGSKYALLGKIFENANCVVFRARRKGDSLPVTIKLPSEEYPPIRKIVRYQREFEIGQRLGQVLGVVHPLTLEPLDHSVALVMEHFAGVSLKQWLEDGGGPLEEVLALAIQIAGSVNEIHALNVIHKDLNPANILYDPQARLTKIIDFGISAVFEHEKTGLEGPAALEGTPAYIAPEQTGNLAYVIDQRSDLYSLGATLYELFTGKKPFESEDLQELLQCHALREPPLPLAVRPGLPKALSDIVMKLLSKSPSRRYQSARGLKADLARCLEDRHSRVVRRDFVLGADDHPHKLLVSEKLYGREKETIVLSDSLSTACAGRAVALMVSGPSGVGKTALVRDLLPRLSEHGALFGSGKFDPLQQSRPYSALVMAFQQLGLRFLSLPDRELLSFQQRLRQALGQNEAVLSGLLPEFRDILGFRGHGASEATPPVSGLGLLPEHWGGENKTRVSLAFQKLVATLAADPAHPLVLFLDDVQWADEASLELLVGILQGNEARALLLIVSFRDSEAPPKGALRRTLETLGQTAGSAHLRLGPLCAEDVDQLLADTLRCQPDEVRALSRLLCQKTQGNPLFLKAYLRALWAKGLLSIDSSTGEWLWDLARIGRQEVAENVAEFLGTKLGALSAQAQAALKIAACFGSRFELQALAAVSGSTYPETNRALLEAAQEGVVTPLSDWSFGLVLRPPLDLSLPSVEFKFVHDRIQQAAYGLLEPNAQKRVHTRIGERLLAEHPLEEKAEPDDSIYDIANHLNLGLAQDALLAERAELARMNLLAGRKAKSTASFGLAYGFLRRGIELLGPEGFPRHRALMIALHEDAAEAACQNADLQATEVLAAALLGQTTAIAEQLKIFGVLLRACNAQHKLGEALSTGRLVLSRLSLPCPARPSRARLLWPLLRTRLAFSGKAIARLTQQPPLTDPVQLGTLEILSTLLQSAYVIAPNLAVLFVLQQARISRCCGDSLYAPYAYASYGALLCMIGDVDTGYRLGKLALALVDRQPNHPQRAKTYVAVFGFILHWKENLRSTLLPLQKAAQFGLESGDLEYATVSALIYCMHSFFCGVELSNLFQETESHKATMIQFSQEWPRVYLDQYRQVILNLLGKAEFPAILDGSAYETQHRLPAHVTGEDKTALFGHWYHNLYLSCLFTKRERCGTFAKNALALLDAVMGQFITSRLTFYAALSELEPYEAASAAGRLGILRRVGRLRGKLTRWSADGPTNHLHLLLLLQAEQYRVRRKPRRAASAYARAMSLAKSSGYVNELAFAAERACGFYVGQQNQAMAEVCFSESARAYQSWGARAKLDHLRSRFPTLVS